jgi:flagellar basal-body rod protein FlgC
MTTFSALQIGRTGVGMAHHWLDAIAHNMANSNTVTPGDEEPFRALRQVVQPLEGGPFAESGSGVAITGQREEAGEPARLHDPAHPMADEDGYVAMPVVDMSGQMVDMMVAQRHYQANMRTVESAREAYQSALRLGGQ